MNLFFNLGSLTSTEASTSVEIVHMRDAGTAEKKSHKLSEVSIILDCYLAEVMDIAS